MLAPVTGTLPTVLLFMDSTTIREIPPLRKAWAPIGQQACVPIIGSHHKRVLSGVMNILTGNYLPYVSASFTQGHFQALLCLTRAHWRGWNIILFVDRASAHTADASQALAADLHIMLRWLPTACPELNVMEERPTDCTGRPRQPQPHPNHSSSPSFGGSDR